VSACFKIKGEKMEEKRICLYCKDFFPWYDRAPTDCQGNRYDGHCQFIDEMKKDIYEKDFILVKYNSSCEKFSSIFPQLNKKRNKKKEYKLLKPS